ncbi:MAG TPA: TM1802 family CRISPR-associated protein [Thermotogota bacterium]|nr:TM1802 family CRISPR-associated protein [Thermotogota bacterium]HRW34946.1 TM1802 family CRISPR-associated protein [Thermotogota bacterium]
MNLTFLNEMNDKYIRTDEGKGVLLAGITLGMLAYQQKNANEGLKISDTPLFKQIHWGKMNCRELKRLMARVPELLKAYNVNYASYLSSLNGKSGELLMKEDAKDLGVNGNFTFTIGFVNSYEYFWKIFTEETHKEDEHDV